jgi:hypothetical protein
LIPTKPSPAFNSIRLRPDELREANSALLRFRDKALETNIHASGMPPGYMDWAANHLRQISYDSPFYANQVKCLAEKVRQDVAKLERERDQLTDGINLQIEELSKHLDVLLDCLPVEHGPDALPVIITPEDNS